VAVPVPALDDAFGAAAPRAPIRVAVVGAGVMGRHHARLLDAHADSTLVAVVDPDAARAAAVAEPHGVEVYPTLEALLAHRTLDAVVIAAPTSLHHALGLRALGAGLHVLVEKPIAATGREALDLIIAAERQGAVLAVGHVERFNPALVALKGIVDDGRLGEITSIVARRIGVMPPRIKDANIVVDLAIHDLDICSWLLGRQPSQVDATAGKAHLSDRYDYSEIFLRYDGTGCFVQASWITPVKLRRLAITGVKGYAELDYITQDLAVYLDGAWPEHNTFGELVANSAAPEPIELERREPLQVELEGFLRAIRGDRSGIVRGVEALGALTVAERALASVEAQHAAHAPGGPLEIRAA
jgi:UDP-N-acetylglucosamine 3-dehydrogenase